MCEYLAMLLKSIAIEITILREKRAEYDIYRTFLQYVVQ